jgi:hypothetical protein
MTEPHTRLLIADDHPIVRAGLLIWSNLRGSRSSKEPVCPPLTSL